MIQQNQGDFREGGGIMENTYRRAFKEEGRKREKNGSQRVCVFPFPGSKGSVQQGRKEREVEDGKMLDRKE